ncbi:RING-H2 finger protein ATL58-like [Momordica charantia]|uniref:RING-type E3 ubiquitin transferase n=1 Tax=Momordica charantia TaxID=3673 RepID=A0A6J1DSI5_MOMCH|nr:RING-H2 finger protein ATL58-like [Momordica charantia]
MAYDHLDPSREYPDASGPGPVSRPAPELKVYQFFVFCIPILCTFILLFLFYLLYLRRRRADWASIRMRTSPLNNNDISTESEAGLKKEFREMLPIIVYNETFSVTDTQCSVCLGEYKTEDKLQRIPSCGHVFHMDCIDHWLSNHATCPLCRLSVLSPSKPPHIQVDIGLRSSNERESNQESPQQGNQTHQQTRPPV